jgi:tRNA A-37 threonylcarbamoyl transferase component Bud32
MHELEVSHGNQTNKNIIYDSAKTRLLFMTSGKDAFLTELGRRDF